MSRHCLRQPSKLLPVSTRPQNLRPFRLEALELVRIFHIAAQTSFKMESTTLAESDLLHGLGRVLAHELNNPISAISSAAYLIDDFASTAEDGKLEVAMIQPFIGSIREECNKMKLVVEEYSKFVSTRSSLPSPANLKEFAEARVRELKSEGLNVELGQVQDGISVNADAGQIQTVFQSITRAAFESGATKVRIDLLDAGSEMQILFNDDRPTEKCEDAEEAFHPIGTKRRHGLGLKLPTAKKIIELHQGRVDAGLKAGEGCCVTVTLPKTVAAP